MRDASGPASGPRGPSRRRKNRRRASPKGKKRGATAPLTERRQLDLDRPSHEPLSDREKSEVSQHFAFLRRFKSVLRLKLNAQEDLLVNGVKPPEDRGVVKHLLGKIDKSVVDRALTKDALSDPKIRTAFLAGVVRLHPEPATLLSYLETVAETAQAREAAEALGATVKKMPFSDISGPQLGRLVEVVKSTFKEHDQTQALLGLLDNPSFRKAYETHTDQVPQDVQKDVRPLAAARRVVMDSQPLPADEAGRQTVAQGLTRWLSAPATILRSYPLDARIRLLEHTTGQIEGITAESPRALLDSIPRDHPRYFGLAKSWAERLLATQDEDGAKSILNELVTAQPNYRDIVELRKALDGKKVGDLRLIDRPAGRLQRAFWIGGPAFGWARVEPNKHADRLKREAQIQTDLFMAGLSPALAHGASKDGAWVFIAARGRPLRSEKRSLREALALSADLVAIAQTLAKSGLELPDLDASRFLTRGRPGQPTLVDLSGVEASDPTRAAMALGPAALGAVKSVLSKPDGEFRNDLPAELTTRLGRRLPLVLLHKALLETLAKMP